MLKKMTLTEMFYELGFDRDPYWGMKQFPVNRCFVEVPGIEDVLEADGYYLCCLVDTKAPNVSIITIRTLKPYLYRDPEYGTLYGWVDSCGNVFDHQDHDIHNDAVRVVAWRAL